MEKKYLAVIIEGGAEKSIVRVLLDNNLLKFNRTDMLDEDIKCQDLCKRVLDSWI